MSAHRRIQTIYAKELIDILRDRRTLVAMVVVPIVLYPLLMLGSIQAVSWQAESMKQEKFIVGTVNERQARLLRDLLDRDDAALRVEREGSATGAKDAAEPPERLAPMVTVVWYASLEELKQRILRSDAHAGVVFGRDAIVDRPDRQTHVDILADREAVRGRFIAKRLEGLFERIRQRTVDRRKQRAGLNVLFDQPLVVTWVNLAAPTSILGRILPLILILMTITGAIYPAIDLTAGERERGTLESLMVCPVPVIDLIAGKFLVVTTVAVLGAALNLASVAATVYFGGFEKVIAVTGGRVPVGKMVFILVCLIPFAVLMSAIMLAVCSFARTFKEAQNYVTPVILAVLIPGGIAALPATKLDGIMLVMPVGNMVLLARDLLLGVAVPLTSVATVLVSTTLYAGAAVAVAANVFGRESVVFTDAGSLASALRRRLIKPQTRPSVSMGLLLVALLFPLWFFVQATLGPRGGEDAGRLLLGTGLLMPLPFVLVPAAILMYGKINVADTFAMRVPSWRHLVGGTLVGLSAWAIAHELALLQRAVVGIPQAVVDHAEVLQKTLEAMPIARTLVLMALVPAVCEELLFRGFLLSSLSTAGRKWVAILVSAAVFGVFHFLLFRFVLTAALGVVLAYLCWQSRSIVPGIVAHFLHNAIGASLAVRPDWFERIGMSPNGEWAHLPVYILLPGGLLFLLGLILCQRPRRTVPAESLAEKGQR